VIEVGRKNDSKKIRLSLVPWNAMRVVVRVLEHGAREYGVDNWRRVPDGPRRYGDAAGRHLVAWWCGEVFDPDTGLHHLAHAVASLLFVLALEMAPPRLPGITARIEALRSLLSTTEDEEGARLAQLELAELSRARDAALGGRR
jgi:hypothetical protein